MASKAPEQTVCVTGASGFIGSWLVRLLLELGYRVRGTVQNIGDEKETKHLKRLEGAGDRLQLFQADLLDYESLSLAIGNSSGVFHVASPCVIEKVEDPQTMLIDPAVKGTLNVLTASHAANVKRVVVTSSMSAMIPNPKLPESAVVDEDSWTDIDYCREKGLWYPLSKTLAEKTASEFAKQNGLDVVFINPGTVLGPMLQPKLNASSAILLFHLKGALNPLEDLWLGCVHVKDIAKAHILVYETSSAKGRYLCLEEILQYSDFIKEVAEMYPHYDIKRFSTDTHPYLVPCAVASRKLRNLGFIFTPRRTVIQDAVASLEENGYL